MKKFLVLLLLFCFSLTGCGNNDSSIDTQEQNNNYTVSRITTTDNVTNINNENLNNSVENINNETELSSFSTKIYTPDDEARQTNIRITCSKLNGTIVKSGETFSFCNTVGKATPEEGYKKADIFDKDGNVIKGYGGRKLSN